MRRVGPSNRGDVFSRNGEPTSVNLQQHPKTKNVLPYAAATFALALLAGWPSLKGGFLAGDDYHLVLNHVLVNHPSPEHAWKILTIVHRDLYQPIPLISFSLDFTLLRWLNLLPVTEGPQAGAWLFHLTNTIIHAANAILVLLVVRRLSAKLSIAVVAAAIFAVHPLASEPIAWINGRMMLLSFFFTMLTVLSFERFAERKSIPAAALTLVFTFLAHMSKISVALPLLAAVFTIVRRKKPDRQWVILWIAVAVVTAAFTVFNISSSEKMFERAGDEMAGSPVIYVICALAQYFRQFVIPVGLSPWYPPPADITWTSPFVLSAAVTVGLVFVVIAATAKRAPVGLLGMFWFLAAVAPTLPIVPARRALAADRYVYLPNVGLVWIAATLLVAGFLYLRRRTRRPTAVNAIAYVGGSAVVISLLATSWSVQAHYRDNIASAERMIVISPDDPGVYEAAAWAYYRDGRYEEAIARAVEDLKRHPEQMACEVFQVVGMAQFRLGLHGQALASLQQAIKVDPDYGKCYSRIAQIQAHLGQTDSAIANYEKAVEIMPFYNPALLPLAALYRDAGRTEDAVKTWQQVLENNPYDVTAHLRLAEVDLAAGRFAEARKRLTDLLGWVPENAAAWTNLGVACERLNQPLDAGQAYDRALALDAGNITAAINKSRLLARQADPNRALAFFESTLNRDPTNVKLVAAGIQLAIDLNRRDAAAALAINAYNQAPNDISLRAWTAFALIEAGDIRRGNELLEQLMSHIEPSNQPATTWTPRDWPAHPRAVSLLANVALRMRTGQYPESIAATEKLLDTGVPQAVRLLINDMQRFSEAHPENPWPFIHIANVMIRQQNWEAARFAIEESRKRCHTDDCRSAQAAAQSGAF